MESMTESNTSSNYVEVSHEYEDDTNELLHVKAKETFWAVSPTPDKYDATVKLTGEQHPAMIMGGNSGKKTWSLFGGQSIYIHDIEDIKGLRKLLDSLESRYILDEMTKGGL